MSRKWRKANKEAGAAAHRVPYGPPVAKAPAHAKSGKADLKSVGVVAAKIALPFLVGAVIRALAKR